MQPLADTLRRAPVPAAEAVQLAAALADALAAKVRDKTRPPRITPGSVLVGKRDDGTVTIEFKAGALPAPSGPVGADERAAVQELGVICYRLLTGKPPIKGNVGLIRDLEAAVAAAAQPDELKSLVLELIAVDPSRRPGLEIAAERLVAIARGTPVAHSGAATVPPPLPPPPKAGGATPPAAKSLPSLPASASPTPKPAPPPITSEPIAPPADLVPAAPVLPAEPLLVASTTRSKKKKNSTDTQERLFFAEGERKAAEERADAGITDSQTSFEATDIDVEPAAAAWWQKRRVLIMAGAGVAVLALLLYVAFGRGGGDKKKKADEEPVAAAASAQPEQPAKVAAAPEPAAEPPPPAPAPEPVAETPPPAPAPEPVAEPPPPEPQPKAPAKKPATSASKTHQAKTPPPPPPKPAAKPPAKPAATSSDPLAQARAARAKGRSSEAYNYYAQAAKGKNAAAGTFGMAEMAYAMKKYGDAMNLAKKAMSQGANSKACWKIIAKSHCAKGEGRSAWFAFSKAGGGDCPR
jgi:hypothetical protein